MNSHQRKKLKKLKTKIKKEVIENSTPTPPSQPNKEEKVSPPPRSLVRRYFSGTISRTTALVVFLVTGFGFLASYAVLRPHLAIEPGLLLNPKDPFSTRFDVKNENPLFAVNDLRTACYTIFVITDKSNVMRDTASFAPDIPILDALDKTTIHCPSFLGGLGAGSGNVTTAFIEIDISYKQHWWRSSQFFPFKGVVDSQQSVHWTHITRSEILTQLPKLH